MPKKKPRPRRWPYLVAPAAFVVVAFGTSVLASDYWHADGLWAPDAPALQCVQGGYDNTGRGQVGGWFTKPATPERRCPPAFLLGRPGEDEKETARKNGLLGYWTNGGWDSQFGMGR